MILWLGTGVRLKSLRNYSLREFSGRVKKVGTYFWDMVTTTKPSRRPIELESNLVLNGYGRSAGLDTNHRLYESVMD